MTLIELLNSDLESYRSESGYAKAVFMRKNNELPKSSSLNHDEVLESVKNAEVKLEESLNIFDNPGWVLLASTDALLTAMKECKIENINAEFEGFCQYMDW